MTVDYRTALTEALERCIKHRGGYFVVGDPVGDHLVNLVEKSPWLQTVRTAAREEAEAKTRQAKAETARVRVDCDRQIMRIVEQLEAVLDGHLTDDTGSRVGDIVATVRQLIGEQP